jgi:hypothetical protein
MNSDLTLPATAAEALGVDASDAKIPRYIGVASEAIRRYLDRPQLHYSAAVVERLAGYVGQVRLRLGVLPVLTVASVVLPDGTSLTGTEYALEDSESGALYRSVGWPYTGLVRSGLLYDAPAVGTEGRTIVATYAGGWVTPAQASVVLPRTLPFDLEDACVQTVKALYRRPDDPNITAESLGDYSVSYRSNNTIIGVGVGGLIPDTVIAQLQLYRRLIS